MDKLRLNRLEVESFMRVKGLRVDAHGNHVVLSGPNASGKSSTVEAIWQALAGASSKTTPEPVHHGDERATVRLDLGEFIVERSWSESGTKLAVTAADGSRISRPQELLDGLLARYALDPVAFLDRRPQDQVDDVLRVCGVEAPVDEVLTITGEDHPVEDGETADEYLTRLSADKTGWFYIRRLEAGRIVDQKLKARREAEQHLESLGGVIQEGEGSNGSDLSAQLESLYERKEMYDNAQRASFDAMRAVEAADKAIEVNDRRYGLLECEITRLDQEIERITKQRNELAVKLAEMESNRGATFVEAVNKAKRDLARARELSESLEDPSEAIDQTKAALRDIDKTNQSISDRKHQARVIQSLALEQDDAIAEHKAIDDKLAALRDLRRRVLEGVDLGVANLSIAEGELKLNGVSFKQASGAEKLRVACAIAMKERPRLRLLRVDDGEHLDGVSRALLFELADQHDFQVVFTRVADGEALRVEVVDAAMTVGEVTA